MRIAQTAGVSGVGRALAAAAPRALLVVRFATDFFAVRFFVAFLTVLLVVFLATFFVAFLAGAAVAAVFFVAFFAARGGGGSWEPT